MSAPQVCTRCRKRRIRCDLHLPACKNCRLADVECFFWDNALNQEMPCSYLYSLRQRVATLKRDLEAVEERGRVQKQAAQGQSVSAASSASAMDLLDPVEGTDYHVQLSTPLADESDVSLNGDDVQPKKLSSHTAYLGPGSTARLAETVLQTAVEWHAARGVPLPVSLRLTKEEENVVPLSLQPRPLRQATLGGGDSQSTPPPPLTVLHDPRKEAELHTLVPLATQRALLEHYSAVLGASSPCYDSLLPAEQEAALLQRAGTGCENPLKWASASANRGTAGAYATTVMFAVATALAARDLTTAGRGGSGGRMAALSLRFRDDVQAIVAAEGKAPATEGTEGREGEALGSLERTRWTVTALATLALLEMIQPTAGQLWTLLGAAISVVGDLREGFVLRHWSPESDVDFVRLERTILRMEARAALHFRRPSPFCTMRLGLGGGERRGFEGNVGSDMGDWQHLVAASFNPASSVVVDDLVVLRSLLQIRQQLEKQPPPPDHILESLIPAPLQIISPPQLSRARLSDSTPLISVQSATLYLALYPSPASVLSSAANDLAVPPAPSRLFQMAAASAYVILNEFHRQNGHGRHRIVSLWMSAERIVEAGIVWALYVLSHPQPPLDVGTAMRPIVQTSSLLASFAARWTAGRAHSEAWDAVVELMWGMT
ncbi:hypothetical protein SBRCBS47491_000606 [Sporothrix bragantina]|uniref:Zn(2)-C6 fungal-type domain-containing protein n=1 Tax=Sporothrix bragantina TaxID=671064 RepID=A0ABP0ARN3_9PEZI